MFKKIPLGIQTFADCIEGGYLYVDKTKDMYQLTQEGRYLFLSRPRRFGKSLLVSTLEAFFLGKRELFSGLWVDSIDYDWPRRAVIKLDFSRIRSETAAGSINELKYELSIIAQQFGIQIPEELSPGARLRKIVREIASDYGRCVILIDEYDAPVLRHLEREKELLLIQEALQDFFASLKSLDSYLHFVFLTGVTRFSKVSLFSGMNQLNDISKEAIYSSLVGFTDDELHQGHLEQSIQRVAYERKQSVEEFRRELKKWYNGYLFSTEEGGVSVYNPYSLLSCLNKKRIENYWFESGSPSFAIQKMRASDMDASEVELGLTDAARLHEDADLYNIDPMSLLFQSGYLTYSIDKTIDTQYRLVFPNEEVRYSLRTSLFGHYYRTSVFSTSKIKISLLKALKDKNLSLLFELFGSLLASIPYDDFNATEGFYRSHFYIFLALCDYHVTAEDHTSMGRIDLTVEGEKTIYLFECKLDRSAKEALEQIDKKRYTEKYACSGKELVLVGVNFSSQKRTVEEWKSLFLK